MAKAQAKPAEKTGTANIKKAAPAAPAAAAAAGPFKVRATKTGYYGEMRRRPGDVFILTDPKMFSDKWMERVGPGTAEKVSTSGDALREFHDEALKQKVNDATGAGAREPEGKVDTGENPLGG